MPVSGTRRDQNMWQFLGDYPENKYRIMLDRVQTVALLDQEDIQQRKAKAGIPNATEPSQRAAANIMTMKVFYGMKAMQQIMKMRRQQEGEKLIHTLSVHPVRTRHPLLAQ